MSAVTIKIQLAGGHQHTLSMPSDDPAVAILMGALAANAHEPLQHGVPELIRLVGRDESGTECAVAFARRALISVATTPPLVDALPTVHESRRDTWLRRMGASGAVQCERPVLATRPDFLPADEREAVLAWILNHQAEFKSSSVRSRPVNQSDDYDFRRSKVMFHLGDLEPGFRARLTKALPAMLTELGEPQPAEPELELQVTAHGHLDRFKAHTDNASPDLRSRRISLVWYLHTRPRAFQGGDLILFDSIIDGDRRIRGDGFQVIEPTDNTLVAFQSHFHHQVRAVACPDGGFEQSRLTVNTWLRDAALAP